MENLYELAVNFGRFIAERDEIHVDEIDEQVVEKALEEFVRQVLKGRELSEEEVSLVQVAL